MKHYFLILCLLICSGCSKLLNNETVELKEAYAKFQKICKEEYLLECIVKPVGNTFWVYVPIDSPILEFKASEKTFLFDLFNPPQKEANQTKGKDQLSVRYVDAAFKDNKFLVEYDIGSTRTYSKDPGYQNTYSQEYQTINSRLLTALNRSFGDVDPIEAPTFAVLVVADIKKGIEVKSLLNVADLNRVMGGSMPQDEFLKRFITEIKGNAEAINDKEGKHLTFTDISMGEFLARQITHRVSYHFQQSPPSPEPPQDIISGLIRETLEAYQFKDFSEISLKDLNDGSVYNPSL